MDWTGGTRRRYAHRGKGNAVLQRQKAHFARVRAADQTRQPFSHGLNKNAIDSGQAWSLMTPPNQRSEGSVRSRHSASARQDSIVQDDIHSHDKLHTSSKAGPASHLRASKTPQTISSRERPVKGRKASDAKGIAALDSGRNMTEEERLLLANRKRLLARQDWLGLSASRPVKYKFPSSDDKDRIGKRRKVDKSRPQRPKPAYTRAMTPLFQDKLPARAHVNETVPDQDFNIQIGTDAFASQTRNSRRSRSLTNTSMRPPSTDFGPISEESMLLGVDGDGFEAGPDIFATAPWQNRFVQDATASDEQRQSSNDETARLYPDVGSTATTFAAPVQDSYASEHSKQESLSSHPASDESPSDTSIMMQRYLADASEAAIGADDKLNSAGHDRPASSASDNEEDEKFFRVLAQVQQYASSSASLAALHSASLHATQSTASAWAPIPAYHDARLKQPRDRVEYRGESERPVAEGHQTNAHEPMPHFRETEQSGIAISDPKIQSTINAHDANAVNEASGEDNDNELWRQFVLGSQSTESISSPAISNRIWNADTDQIMTAAALSSDQAQVRSDNVTVGDSVCPKDDATDGDGSVLDDTDVSIGPGTSMVGHATTTNAILDDVEDPAVEESRSLTTGNIHASSSTSLLDPRRFKRPRKHGRLPPTRAQAGFGVSKHERSQLKRKSVYDIGSER